MPEVKRISLTIGELSDQGLWEEFCELTGRDAEIINDGYGVRDDIVWMTEALWTRIRQSVNQKL